MSQHSHQKSSSQTPTKVRLDKWLFAARFYKTRSIAKQAIDGGKVRVNGHSTKASKEVEIGMTLSIRQGFDEKEVEVTALSDIRRGAPEAAGLYCETQTSILRRKSQGEQRKLQNGQAQRGTCKPNTKQRRQIHQFKRKTIE